MCYTHFELKLSTSPLHDVRYLFSMKPLVVDLCAVWREKERRRNSNIFSSAVAQRNFQFFWTLEPGANERMDRKTQQKLIKAPNEHFESSFQIGKTMNFFDENFQTLAIFGLTHIAVCIKAASRCQYICDAKFHFIELFGIS